MPRWQPAPRRVEVEAATDRLLAIEAQIWFGRTAARRALRMWAYGEDERPMVRRLATATAHWSSRAIQRVWAVWHQQAQHGATCARRLNAVLGRGRSERLQDAWRVWWCMRARAVCDRLGLSEASRLSKRREVLFDRWRSATSHHNKEFADLLLKATVFRRWALMHQTAPLSRSIFRDQLETIEIELSRDLLSEIDAVGGRGGTGLL